MRLTDEEKAMRDGRDGRAIARAMDLLVRYGEALGADDFVETRNVCGTVTATTPFMRDFAIKFGRASGVSGDGPPLAARAPSGGSDPHAVGERGGDLDAVFSEFNLDSSEVVSVPKVKAFSSHLQLGFDPHHPREMGVTGQMVQFYNRSEAMAAKMGVQMMNTCTPYQVGNVPTRGEHCAWMESSAVVYCNSVLGARTNTEGRESTSAAMLTCRIPNWGYHLDEPRLGTLGVQLDMEVKTVEDWGLLGYWLGDWVQDRVAVIEGMNGLGSLGGVPNLPRLKHFGAAASSSGGVELYHIVGVTPEANTAAQAYGGRKPQEVRHYGPQQRRETYERINQMAHDTDVDYVMLGCPHYTIEQIWEAAQLLEGRRVHENAALWIFTPWAIKALADRNGYTKIIEDAGGVLMTDSCSAMSRAVPPGTKVVALDSAKQAHYLPAILGVQAWFGTTEQCIDAACTGKWRAG